MRLRRRTKLALLWFAAGAVCVLAASAGTAVGATGISAVPKAGTGGPQTGAFTPWDGTAGDEFPGGDEADQGPAAFSGTISLSSGPGRGSSVTSAHRAKSNPTLNTSFEGLNLYQQRYARGGNQFTVEPPDQALCVGNGYVLEAVNDVLNVYDAAGASVLPDNTATNVVSGFPRNVNHAVDLNSFFGYPPAVNRSIAAGQPRFGQFVTDPTCLYDASTQRFFVVVLTLETNAVTGGFTEANHLDIAVSETSNPTGQWNIYRVPVTDDGSNPDASNACACLGDYPHIGADANGFYITTNSYPWEGNGFDGAQIYAFSKAQLAAGASTVTMQHIDTFGTVNAPSDAGSTQPGFTLWPAQSPGTGSFNLSAGGTEYLLSSNAADEAQKPVSGAAGTRSSNQLIVWALTNTSSLNTASPHLGLGNAILTVSPYGVPPRAKQPGTGTPTTVNEPQGYCLNDETTPLIFGFDGCWNLLVSTTAHNATKPESIMPIDANDTRMQQVMYANGKLWGALDTAVTPETGGQRAGIAWFVVKPDTSGGTLAAKLALQGTYGQAGYDFTYPAIGVTPSGRGVVAFTAVGDTLDPSAAYAPIDALAGVGPWSLAAEGAAADDGFSGYKAQRFPLSIRPRWGDYGAAAVVGNSIWIASEYIAHSCDYTTWGGPFFVGGSGDNLLGTCAGTGHGPGTRTALGNWSTRISKLTP